MTNEKTLKAKLPKSEVAKLARTAHTVSPANFATTFRSSCPLSRR